MQKNILFPIDTHSKHALDSSFATVIELVQCHKAKLHFMTVIPNYNLTLVQQYFPKGWLDDIRKKAQNELMSIAQKYLPKDLEINFIVECGPIYKCIIDTASNISADLIVMSAHRPELKDYLLGPNAAKVVRHARTSVFIIR